MIIIVRNAIIRTRIKVVIGILGDLCGLSDRQKSDKYIQHEIWDVFRCSHQILVTSRRGRILNANKWGEMLNRTDFESG